MFGMGFTEILLISVFAIIFLGPDRLPSALVEVARFLKSAKDMIYSAKESIEEEVNIESLKKEAMEYKRDLETKISEYEDEYKKEVDIEGEISSLKKDIEEIDKEFQDDLYLKEQEDKKEVNK